MMSKSVTEKVMKSFERRRGESDPEFREWLQEREHLGYLFNSRMYRRLFAIWKQIHHNDKDHLTIICGQEGIGKSTIGLLMGMIISPTFKINQVAYKQLGFIQALKEAKKGDSLLLDEGALVLLSREAMTKQNRSTLKIFALVRQKNLNLIACVPNYWNIDKNVRTHRARTLIYAHRVKDKRDGRWDYRFRVFNKKGIDKINESPGLPLMKIRVKKTDWFDSRWFKYGESLPEHNDINWEAYSSLKGESFDSFLEEMEAEAIKATPKGSQVASEEGWLTISQARKIVPLARLTYRKMIDEKTIESRFLIGKWFIKRDSLNKFIDKPPSEGGV